jgi:hypothetical protein
MRKLAHFALIFVAVFTLSTLVWLVLIAPGAAAPAGSTVLSQLLVHGLVTSTVVFTLGVSTLLLVRWARSAH